MLSSDFDQLYDKVQHLKVNSSNSCNINELNPGATMNHLQIVSDGKTFQSYPADIIKSMPNNTTDKTSFIKDSDCDGVTFMISPNDHEYLLLSELKSNFDTGKICEAFNQEIHSFLKLHSLFCLCESYSLEDLPVIFIVACKCYKDKAQESSVLSKISDEMALGKRNFETKFLNRLLCNESIDVTMNEFSDIKKNKFHQGIKNKHIVMKLCTTLNYTDDSVSVRIE